MHFKIKKKTQLKKLMEAYCARKSLQMDQICFLFDGKLLRDSQSTGELEMEDDDVIDVIKMTMSSTSSKWLNWYNTSRRASQRAFGSSTWKRTLSSAVWEATLGRHTSAVSLLLAHGASANARYTDENLKTALHLSAHQGHLDIVQALLKAGADVDAKDVYSSTSLTLSAHQGHFDVVQALLKAGADVDAKDVNSYTALHGAAYDGHLDVVQALLKAGADVHAKGWGGVTALSWAKSNNHAEVAAILRAAGAQN